MGCTAKRLRNSAQGCRAARLPWVMGVTIATPTGLCQFFKGGRIWLKVAGQLRLDWAEAATPFGVARLLITRSQGSRAARQPWAVLHNRFAVNSLRIRTCSMP